MENGDEIFVIGGGDDLFAETFKRFAVFEEEIADGFVHKGRELLFQVIQDTFVGIFLGCLDRLKRFPEMAAKAQRLFQL